MKPEWWWVENARALWRMEQRHKERDAALANLIERLSAMEMPLSWCLTSSGEEPGDISAEQGYDGNFTHRYRRKVVGRKE